MSCEYQNRCGNNEKCFVCNDMRLLKLPEDKNRQRLQSKAKSIAKKVDLLDDCSESWNDLEATVAAKISAIPTVKQYTEMRDARRQVRSGAIWFMPGDVTDTIILVECKERSSTTAKGEKNITIPKSWLTKLDAEAKLDGKYPTFAFRYKNDEQIYSINKFEILEDMVTEIKFLRMENESVKLDRDKYKYLCIEQAKELAELKALPREN